MSRSLDYMCDWNDSVRGGRPDYRRGFIGALGCAFGTTGGPVVEPPQHWARERWFLPTCRRVHEHLRKLHADGGRAVEFFFHILANPSSEITFEVAGRTLAAPTEPLEKMLADAVEELYQPRDTATREALAKFFLDAEEAYFRHQPGEHCGTLSLEPLIGDRAGLPVYLRDRLKAPQREAYGRDLERLAGEFKKLRDQVRSVPRAERVAACLKGVQEDVRGAANK